jgi:hypothetical protein
MILEDFGINRENAEEILRGLRQAGRLVQKSSGEWDLP